MSEKKRDKCCGNCSVFEDEDIEGVGFCAFHLQVTGCDYRCEDYETINEELKWKQKIGFGKQRAVE